MIFRLPKLLVLGFIAGAMCGLFFGKGEVVEPMLVMGVIGAMLGLLGMVLTKVLPQASGPKCGLPRFWLLFGGILGGCIGAVAGSSGGLGRVMISIFNPDLPERDFGASFGAIGGGFLGVAIGVMVIAMLMALKTRTK